jgi:ATP-dependent helicase/nuclease subunit B
MLAAPNLYTIPASVPFLPTLIATLTGKKPVQGFPTAQDPLALAAVTLFLPTRRACRLAREVFLQVLGTNAALLPRIVAIGDLDEDEIVFSQMATGASAADALALPGAIGSLERQLLLSTYILKWTSGIKPDTGAPLVAHTPTAALSLAGDLGRLMDDVTTRQVSWDKFDTLVPQEHDKYWELTLDFLKIARQTWPAILKERGEIDAAQRRDLLIEAETQRLKAHGGLVVAAGSTGSMPSTAKLLETIASLPQGAVVLPGLDTDLDEHAWRLIGQDEEGPAAGHPQFALAALLERMGVSRKDVRRLGATTGDRERLVSEALRPAAATEHWRKELEGDAFQAHADSAMSSLAVIEAAHSEDEALAIAIALRETVNNGKTESADRTAALITPDRALARRVLAALTRWQVPVDDSGGGPLTETLAGVFARLAAECALGGVEPVTLLALLKHPLCGLALRGVTLDAATSALERAILRGPRPRAGTDGLLHALATFDALRREPEGLHYRDPRARLGDDEFNAAQALALALKESLAPLEGVTGESARLSDMAARHRAVIAALTGVSGEDADLPITERDGGAVLAQLLADVAVSETAASLNVTPKEYPEIFQTIAAGKVMRRPGAPGARVRIYGPLEARLQQADRVILGGLNEGTWPPDTRNDPWLSRPMRRELGLDLPERRVGLSAHDFAQALGAPEVILTRAAKVAGAPTVASRFLQRLAAVAGETRWNAAKARGAQYLAWAHVLDKPDAIVPAPRPAPTPAVAIRPKRLSVTEIEHWLRDPYTIYARHILKLAALDPVDAPPGARDRGTLIHEAIGNFTKEFAGALPESPLAELLSLGSIAFAPLMGYPQARAFWWPRFQRIAQWFVTWDESRRANVSALHVEIDGKIDVTPDFVLTTRADRIEQLNDGRYAVLDFKTGRPPGAQEVATGLAPQLTLEAAILREGGFSGIPAKSEVAELAYVRVSGGQKAGEFAERIKDGNPNEAADKALARLREVALAFARQETPYLSFARPQWVGRTYSDYDHLARVKEWSATGGEPDENIPDL